MRGQPFADDLADRHARIEGRIRVLEDDLDVLAQNAHLRIAQATEVDARIAHGLVLLEHLVVGVFCPEGVHRRLLVLPNRAQSGRLRLQRAPAGAELFRPPERAADLAGGALGGGVFLQLPGDGLVKRDLRVEIPHPVVQPAQPRRRAIRLEQRSSALLRVVQRGKPAQNLDHALKGGLRLRLQQVHRLMLVKRGFVARLLNLGSGRVGLDLLLTIGLEQLVGFFERDRHIGGGKVLQGAAVVHRAAGRLVIELEDRAPQRGLAAARFSDQAERLAAPDVDGDLLVGADVQLLLLEEAGLGYRKILFKIPD